MFAFTENDRWEPGIGDPTAMGWLTVVAYFTAAFLCWRAASRNSGSTPASRRSGAFWTLLAAGLVLLGINKQLDLQTWLTLFGKHLALNEGWYRERRFLQAAFIGAVAVGGAAALFGMRMLAGQITRPTLAALAGSVLLGCFILIRASSFHHVDHALGFRLAGVKVNWILELGSIACIGAAAWLACRPPRPSGLAPERIQPKVNAPPARS